MSLEPMLVKMENFIVLIIQGRFVMNNHFIVSFTNFDIFGLFSDLFRPGFQVIESMMEFAIVAMAVTNGKVVKS